MEQEKERNTYDIQRQNGHIQEDSTSCEWRRCKDQNNVSGISELCPTERLSDGVNSKRLDKL